MHDSLVRGWNTNVALERLDGFAAHFAIECRHPFFDRRLVEFMFAVPEEQRWHGPWRKRILRLAMAGILPEEVRNRQSKADFTPFVDRELRRRADYVDRMLDTSVLASWGIIDIARFRQLFQRFCQTPVSHEERLACRNVIGLELWYQSGFAVTSPFVAS
jgi:asparagine synthase (glutamine-hydrolysing)